MMTEKKVDVTVRNEGTLFLFTPETAEAKQWIDEHVSGESQWFGKALVVEHRFAEDLACGMLEAGLVIA